MQQSEHGATMETNPSYAVHLFLGGTLKAHARAKEKKKR
jgi:hypothetical protein